jgi:hypothetical protein
MMTNLLHRFQGTKQIIFLSAFLFVCCKKEEVDTEPTEQAETAVIIPEQPEAADAVLICVRSSVEPLLPGLPPSNVDLVRANFGSVTSEDVGDVKLNNVLLRKLPNNTYINGDLVIDYKIDPGSNPLWTVAGGGTFPALNYRSVAKIPGLTELQNVPTSLIRASGQSFSIKELPTNSSGVLWLLADARGNKVQKQTSGTEVSFSASELSALQASRNAVIQAVNFSTETLDTAGKRIFFVLETMDYQYLDIE